MMPRLRSCPGRWCVLNKLNLKPEQFDIQVVSTDDAQAKKNKKEALIKKMIAKINPRSGGPTQNMLEACFKFAATDNQDSFYLAQKPTSDQKKFYTEKLASYHPCQRQLYDL